MLYLKKLFEKVIAINSFAVQQHESKLHLYLKMKVSFTTAQKFKFSIKDIFSHCDQIRRKLAILSYLLKKSLMENFISCAVHSLCYMTNFFRFTSYRSFYVNIQILFTEKAYFHFLKQQTKQYSINENKLKLYSLLQVM